LTRKGTGHSTGRSTGRGGLFSWCLFDGANSAFPTVITTFLFAAYFTQGVAVSPTEGTAAWGHAQSLAALVIAFAGPVFGAIADKGGRRKPWLFAFTLLAVVSSACLWFTRPEPDDALWALTFVVLGTIGFEIGMVFYNALLPELAPADRLGRISGWGWGFGYIGGLACLGIALVGFVQTDTPLFGLDPASAEPVRASAILVAVWMSVFALPLFLFTPDHVESRLPLRIAARQGLEMLISTLRRIRDYAHIARFLFARLLYIDGMNTLFAFGGIYAAGSFGFTLGEVITFGIAINLTAALGAVGFAWVDDWIGPKRTILISLVGLIVFGAALIVAEGQFWFWAFALPLGVFVGPVQAASRSMMARLAPADMHGEMFGLYAFSGKATAFLGPALLAWVTLLFDSQRAGMATVLIFLIAGLLFLLPVKDVR